MPFQIQHQQFNLQTDNNFRPLAIQIEAQNDQQGIDTLIQICREVSQRVLDYNTENPYLTHWLNQTANYTNEILSGSRLESSRTREFIQQGRNLLAQLAASQSI